MARNSVTGQSLKMEGQDALEDLQYQEERLQDALVEIREYKPEATVEDAKQMLRDRDNYRGVDDDCFDPVLGGWMSW